MSVSLNTVCELGNVYEQIENVYGDDRSLMRCDACIDGSRCIISPRKLLKSVQASKMQVGNEVMQNADSDKF